jgi:hypothetical protein
LIVLNQETVRDNDTGIGKRLNLASTQNNIILTAEGQRRRDLFSAISAPLHEIMGF